jgi:hypothetical protein
MAHSPACHPTKSQIRQTNAAPLNTTVRHPGASVMLLGGLLCRFFAPGALPALRFQLVERGLRSVDQPLEEHLELSFGRQWPFEVGHTEIIPERLVKGFYGWRAWVDLFQPLALAVRLALRLGKKEAHLVVKHGRALFTKSKGSSVEVALGWLLRLEL